MFYSFKFFFLKLPGKHLLIFFPIFLFYFACKIVPLFQCCFSSSSSDALIDGLMDIFLLNCPSCLSLLLQLPTATASCGTWSPARCPGWSGGLWSLCWWGRSCTPPTLRPPRGSSSRSTGPSRTWASCGTWEPSGTSWGPKSGSSWRRARRWTWSGWVRQCVCVCGARTLLPVYTLESNQSPISSNQQPDSRWHHSRVKRS